MFPFTINYTRHLSNKLSYVEIAGALDQIKEVLEDKTAEDVEIRDNHLTFKTSFFGLRWNWNVMVPIDKGEISLTSNNVKTILTYKIFMYRLFVITAIMSTIMGFISQQIGFGVFCFVWLCGMNWVIGVSRHGGLISDIAVKISNKSTVNT
jgi:hypothetical protein